ncbi:MAG TPA: aldo/keto reductase, partial [Thermoflexales bacterium]|nr:aldo/keto reductase [Thermoflexales bacterium]
YSHRFDPRTPLEETMMALDYAVRSGRAFYAGISSYDATQTREAAKILRSLGTPCLIHQPYYNMFGRWIEDGLMDALADNGMGCIAFSPLAQGLLTDKYLGGIPQGSRAAKDWGYLKAKDITPEKIDKVARLNEIAARRGQTLAQMALAWCLRLPGMTSVVIGASKVAQIEDGVAALNNLSFGEDELRQIEDALA